jgi:Na+/H+ antiporter NhaB
VHFFTDHFLRAHKASIDLTGRGIPWRIRFAVVQKLLHVFTVLEIAVILSCAIAIAHTCAITYFCAYLGSFRVVTIFISLGMLASVGRVTASRDSSSKYKQGRQQLHDENGEEDS